MKKFLIAFMLSTPFLILPALSKEVNILYCINQNIESDLYIYEIICDKEDKKCSCDEGYTEFDFFIDVTPPISASPG